MNSATHDKLKEKVWEGLAEVYDPEIPKLSVVDLGMITEIKIDSNGTLKITMTPTFAACPAINYIKENIKDKAEELKKDLEDIKSTKVEVSYKEQWTSDRITKKGRKKLKEFGLTPPPSKKQEEINEESFKNVECPHCSSTDTELRTPFGSTLCRAIHYCNNCKETFEQFKPV